MNEREDDGGNGENFGFVCRLDAGQTYYLEAGAANGQSGGFAVRAERYQPEMNALKVLTAETLENRSGIGNNGCKICADAGGCLLCRRVSFGLFYERNSRLNFCLWGREL